MRSTVDDDHDDDADDDDALVHPYLISWYGEVEVTSDDNNDYYIAPIHNTYTFLV